MTIEANKREKGWEEKDENVVQTDFTIKVPQSVNLDLKVFSSPVQISGVTGTHKVHGFSSDLRLDKVTGPVDAETFSGQIYLAPAIWQQGQSVHAKTFSGDIEVRLPESAVRDGRVRLVQRRRRQRRAARPFRASRSGRCARVSTTPPAAR